MLSAVYEIVNLLTNDSYIGSSKNVFRRLAHHKCPSVWANNPNISLYQDMQEYGVDKFSFRILKEIEPKYLKQVEQDFIQRLHPTYNCRRAEGWNLKRYKKYYKKYCKDYFQSEIGKKVQRKGNKKYHSQLCLYKGETLTLGALISRFQRAFISHPGLEAKKYLAK